MSGNTDYLEPHLDRSALLLIDLQHDFVDGAMPVPGTATVLPRIARLAEAFRAAGRPVFHVVRLYTPGSSDVDAVRREYVESGARIAAPGTPGAEIPPVLLPGGAGVPLDPGLLTGGSVQYLTGRERILWKPRWSAFFRTDLDHLLREDEVDTVVVAGCNLPNCPRATLFDASERDYRCVLVTDAVSQVTAARVEDLELIGVRMSTVGGLAGALGALG